MMFQCLPDSAGANGDLAELAGQLGKMVEQPNQSQPTPGLRADGTPCTEETKEETDNQNGILERNYLCT